MGTTNPTPLIIFVHIPKTGGTTLQSIIRRQYPPHAIRTAHLQRATATQLEALARDCLPATAIVQGHLSFGLHEFLPRRSTYITLLRDPIDRVISNYHWILSHPANSLHETLRSEGTSLEEYASSGRFPSAANRQTRFLAGSLSSDTKPSPEPCSTTMLEAAKRNLREHFSVVGLMERFDQTSILLKRAFRWRSVLYSQRHVDPKRAKRSSISRHVLRSIQESNELDVELYEYGRGLFEEQLSRQPLDFDVELEAFRRVNREYAGHPLTLLT